MFPWLARALRLIQECVRTRNVAFTQKSESEVDDLMPGFGLEDALDVIEGLAGEDFAERVKSALTEEWLYVFKPLVFDRMLYVKIALRAECVVVSFHEDADGTEDEDGS